MNTAFSIFADLMLWFSLPLYCLIGYWEENMSITSIDRGFLQFLLVACIFIWVSFWYSRGMRDRLSHHSAEPPVVTIENARFEVIKTFNSVRDHNEIDSSPAIQIETKENVLEKQYYDSNN